MNPKLSIPFGCQFNTADAVELLRLTQEAQKIHSRFKEESQSDWETLESLHLPDYGEYEILVNLGRAEFLIGRYK
ncbi:hypothetical protein KFU94_05295 [Chloroflexi bacterium TSY]|nr:hypothetical protein [Chloroflexi bacterium TSY]